MNNVNSVERARDIGVPENEHRSVGKIARARERH